MRRGLRIAAIIAGSLLLLCIAAAGISALSNRNLPTGPTSLDRLDPLDKARLAEALHLRQELGDTVWPGWGQTEMPVILWNREYSFLVDHPGPPPGWTAVPEDTFAGQVYYRQPSVDPQNFAVRVGDRWAASLATKWEVDAFLMGAFRQALPGPLATIFPYRLIIQPSEVQMTGLLHEAFHVFQAQIAPQRLDEAEKAHRHGERYWQADEAMRGDWSAEIALLAKALNARSGSDRAQQACRFLAQRENRRQTHHVDADLIGFERQLEWEEGLAKYVELAIWRQAYSSKDYQPLAELTADPSFKRYATFPQRWSQEVSQMKRQATRQGETRFYYTGMAQAMLLDRLLPIWKAQALTADAWLETLLARACR